MEAKVGKRGVSIGKIFFGISFFFSNMFRIEENMALNRYDSVYAIMYMEWRNSASTFCLSYGLLFHVD
jgi:hypothetical protein